jgi:hypothetical protein
MHLSKRKGKSYIEIYGQKTANHMLKLLSRPFEERFGKERANKIKKKISVAFKDKTKEEIYGEAKAKKIKKQVRESVLKAYNGPRGKEIREKISKANKGKPKPGTSKAMKGMSLEDRIGKEKADKVRRRCIKLNKSRTISKENIIKTTKEKFLQYGAFPKSKFYKIVGINDQTVRNKFGSLDTLAEEANIEFKRPKHRTTGGIGKNERFARKMYELQTGHKIIPHFKVETKTKTYIVDWFDADLNSPIEFDESHHKYQRIQDEIRENDILSRLNCNKFIRIDEKDFLSKITSSFILKP